MNKLVVLVIVMLAGSASAEEIMPKVPPENPARQGCVDALNADPTFAKSVVETYNKKAVEQIDQQTVEAHKKSAEQVAENERHVVYAYAAMWILAAGFVVFLWLRQQALKNEIAQLRKDLDAAAKEAK